MNSCGAYEAILDARGAIVAIGPRLASMIGLTQAELVGRPIGSWVRGAVVHGPAGVPGALELRSEGQGAVAGLGLRTLEGERSRLTFLPEATRHERAERHDPRRDPEARIQSELVREVYDALSGVVGFAGLVQVAPTPHRRKFYVDQIASQAERCRRLVQALDPAASTRAPFIRPVDLGAELTRALSGLRAAVERSGISFDVELPAEAIWASCDARAVGDILVAFVARATVAQRREHQANEVVLSVGRAAGQVELRLVLTGADEPHMLLRERFGMDPELTATSATELELRGARAVLERQGGSLRIERDEEREEVRATLTLPAAPTPRRTDIARTPVPLEVLVVDEDPMLGELYQEMLGVSGHTVTACRSVYSAREALRGQRFDAMVAEFQLRDGLLSELWAIASTSHPELASRLLVVTRDPRDPRLLDWAAHERTPILAKPFQASSLLEHLVLLTS